MFAGVGIIGALASILASILVPAPPIREEAAAPAEEPGLQQELAQLRGEIAELRALLAGTRRDLSEPTSVASDVARTDTTGRSSDTIEANRPEHSQSDSDAGGFA
jgi:hypothetical protein